MNNSFNLSKDSLAILLICSNLAMSKDEEIKPYTTRQWNILADKLIDSSIKRPSMLFETNEELWKSELFLDSAEVNRLKKLLSRSGQLSIELESLYSVGIKISTRAEPNYPKRLKEVLRKNCPPILFYCGDMSIVEKEAIAIVGSRNVDEKGLLFTKEITSKCVSEGYNIVSGGARGVDSCAESTALSLGGKVISFVADSLIQKVKRKEIRENITKGNLLLMSVTNPKSGFKVYSAMDRNKYIYCLSNYAVVVSSDYNKGGTWAGATDNLKNKWVPMFVREDKSAPKGNQELINMGANPIDLVTINDKALPIKEWNIVNTTSSEKKEKGNEYRQIYINELLNESLVREDDSVKEKQECETDSYDLYYIVWPYIEKVLIEPKTTLELCESFKINKSQMNEWIDRALKEKRIKKLTKPVRYVLT